MNLPISEHRIADALKSIARNLQLKDHIRQSKELYPLLLRAAERFVAGEHCLQGLACNKSLLNKGYLTSLEYIGENTLTEEECTKAVMEFSSIIQTCSNESTEGLRISLDLSHIGSSVDPDLAYHHLLYLAEQAEQAGLQLMISMEESAKTDAILSIFNKVSPAYLNVGITLQAHLPRTLTDLEMILSGGSAPIRIVKGAYQEREGEYIPRSPLLNERYIQLVDMGIRAGRKVSVATHDDRLIEQILCNFQEVQGAVEIEMLYGIRPELAKRLKNQGVPVRIYLTYGEEWFLYLCHRIAEHPPNLYDAMTRMIQGAEDSLTLY